MRNEEALSMEKQCVFTYNNKHKFLFNYTKRRNEKKKFVIVFSKIDYDF